jgi:predicted N-acetyltransferase YhbS
MAVSAPVYYGPFGFQPAPSWGFDLPRPVDLIPFQGRVFSDDGVGGLLPVVDRKTQPWNSGRGRGLTSQATSMPLAT